MGILIAPLRGDASFFFRFSSDRSVPLGKLLNFKYNNNSMCRLRTNVFIRSVPGKSVYDEGEIRRDKGMGKG